MNNKKWKIIVLGVILAIASFFVFYKIDQADPLTDEIQIAFRSIGWLDFLGTPYQTTPQEWFKQSPPNWVNLSFHDHPPLTFALEFLIIRIFGSDLFWLRIIFGLFGLGSIFLIFKVSQKLFNNINLALMVALLAATNSYLIWISRIGLQEIIVIFFSLLTLYFLIKSQDNKKYFIYWGVALGLGLLTKYTILILIPISLVYLIIFDREKFREKYLYIGCAVVAIFFSPVIFYNIKMYQMTGHFDVQFATLFHQTTPEWLVLAGKNIGSFNQRIVEFFPALINNSSPIFFAGFIFSVGYLICSLLYKFIKKIDFKIELFLFITLLLYYSLLVFIGPSQRFLAMMIPFMILALVYVLVKIFLRNNHTKIIGIVLFGIFILYEAFFTFQTLLVKKPIFDSPWIYSKLRNESPNFGYNNLESFFKKNIDLFKPAIVFPASANLAFINDVRKNDFLNLKNNKQLAALVVFDPRMDNYAKFWIFGRRYYYAGWPIISLEDYLAAKNSDVEFFNKLGFNNFYYIATTEATQVGASPTDSPNAQIFNDELKQKGIVPKELLSDPLGNVVFQIYYSNKDFSW